MLFLRIATVHSSVPRLTDSIPCFTFWEGFCQCPFIRQCQGSFCFCWQILLCYSCKMLQGSSCFSLLLPFEACPYMWFWLFLQFWSKVWRSLLLAESLSWYLVTDLPCSFALHWHTDELWCGTDWLPWWPKQEAKVWPVFCLQRFVWVCYPEACSNRLDRHWNNLKRMSKVWKLWPLQNMQSRCFLYPRIFGGQRKNVLTTN